MLGKLIACGDLAQLRLGLQRAHIAAALDLAAFEEVAVAREDDAALLLRDAADLADAEIRRIAQEERRIVLTRDRDLLKCREIERGCYVRALQPEAQLREVAARYQLAKHARPFTLCLHCN